MGGGNSQAGIDRAASTRTSKLACAKTGVLYKKNSGVITIRDTFGRLIPFQATPDCLRMCKVAFIKIKVSLHKLKCTDLHVRKVHCL